jgi:hypothetical protein
VEGDQYDFGGQCHEGLQKGRLIELSRFWS